MATAITPRVTKGGKSLHLSYELPHRIYDSTIYPIPAPNGSTVVLYGHERGLTILWRGGRRRKTAAAGGQPNGAHTDIIDLISDDEGTAPQPRAQQEDDYDSEEDEQDSDCPYPSVIYDLQIDFGNDRKPVAALHLAIPSITALGALPAVLRTHAAVTVASSDGKLRLLQIPLAPPPENQQQQAVRDIVSSAIELFASGPIPASISVKYFPAEHQRSDTLRIQHDQLAGHLLVASATRALSVWSLAIHTNGELSTDIEVLHKVALPTPPSSLAFHPSSRTSQLLLADPSGVVRIFDTHGTHSPRRRPDSGDSMLSGPTVVSKGRWIMTFHTSFHAAKETSQVSAALARRKKVLDARWVLGGRVVLVLLEDGEWGFWDTVPPQSDKSLDTFTIHGFLGTANAAEVSNSSKPRKGSSSLAPMTPNTRRVKNDEFFKGETKVPGVAARGGISVSSNSPRTGPADESVVLWYGSDMYSIDSIQQFWQRSTSTSGGFGSLYSPGLSHITDVRLMNEAISSVSLFASKAAGSGIGQMNTQHDLLVSADHRIIVLQTLRPTTPSRQLFQAAERPAARDQQMLDIGDLDLDGVDRMLDNMDAAPRRVGFAAR